MKRIVTKFALLIIVASFLITSCSEDKADDGEGVGSVPESGKLVFNFDGKKIELIGFLNLTSTGNIRIAAIGGYNTAATGDEISGGSVIIYAMNGKFIEAGDYPLLNSSNVDKFAKIEFSAPNTEIDWVSQSGTLTISKITDTEIQGTFSGKAALSADKDKKLKSFSGGFNAKKIN